MAVTYNVKVAPHRPMANAVKSVNCKQIDIDNKLKDLVKYLEIAALALNKFAEQQEINNKKMNELRKEVSDMVLQQQDLTGALNSLVENLKHAISLMKFSATNPADFEVKYKQ